MNADRIYRQVWRKPYGYVWFGPYWYNLKAWLREQGYDLGSHDDPELRAQMAHRYRTPRALIRAAFEHYRAHYGTYSDGMVTLPDGSERYLNDPDMTLYAPTGP